MRTPKCICILASENPTIICIAFVTYFTVCQINVVLHLLRRSLLKVCALQVISFDPLWWPPPVTPSGYPLRLPLPVTPSGYPLLLPLRLPPPVTPSCYPFQLLHLVIPSGYPLLEVWDVLLSFSFFPGEPGMAMILKNLKRHEKVTNAQCVIWTIMRTSSP